jgi:hypothetical protein
MAGEGVLATLQAAWEALSSVDAPKAVIGGLALVAWKHARYTRDADILVAIEADRIDELVRVLANAGFQARCLGRFDRARSRCESCGRTT